MEEPCIYENLLYALYHLNAGKAALENITVEEVPQVHLQVRFYLKRGQQANNSDSYDVRVVIRVLGETPIQKLSDHTSGNQPPSQHCMDEDVLIIPKAVETGHYATALASQLLQILATQSLPIRASGLLHQQLTLYLKRYVNDWELAEGNQHKASRPFNGVPTLGVRDSCAEIRAVAPPHSPSQHGAHQMCEPYKPMSAACTPIVINSELFPILCSTYISLLIYLQSQRVGHSKQPPSTPSIKSKRYNTMKHLVRLPGGRKRGMSASRPMMYALKPETNNEVQASFASKSIRSNPLFSYDGQNQLDALLFHGYDTSVASPQSWSIGTMEAQHTINWHTNSRNDPFHQPLSNAQKVEHALPSTLFTEHDLSMNECKTTDADDDSLCTQTCISCEQCVSAAALTHGNPETDSNSLKQESSLQRLVARRRDARYQQLHHVKLSRATIQNTLTVPPSLNIQQKCLNDNKSKQETLYKTQAMIQQAVDQVASLRDALTSLRTTIGTPCA